MLDRRAFLAASAGAALAAPSRLNFVFLLADDLGWSDLACYGSRFHETPHLDAFARTGMRFTQAYSACPVCSPTRTALMTGKYPARVGLTDYLPGLQPQDKPLLSVEDLDELPAAEITIAEALRDAGYRTFTRGKWHLGERGPDTHGFTAPLKGPASGNRNRDAATVEDCLRFLEEAAEDPKQPFFCYLAFTYPHTPVQAVSPFVDHFRSKLRTMNYPEQRLAKEREGNTRLHQDNPEYASMIARMDEMTGQVLAKLESLHLSERTVVIFTSDNGGLCTHRNPQGGPTANPPLRSGKGWCYEGGIRVPLIMRVPGVTRPGTANQTPVITTDFYPTMLELAGLPPRPQQHMDGVSLLPLLRGGRSLRRDTLYWHYPHYHGSTWAPGAALRSGDWKLIEFYEEGKAELYNLKSDIGERHDLASEMPARLDKLRAQLRSWQQQVGAKMPPRNPRSKASNAPRSDGNWWHSQVRAL